MVVYRGLKLELGCQLSGSAWCSRCRVEMSDNMATWWHIQACEVFSCWSATWRVDLARFLSLSHEHLLVLHVCSCMYRGRQISNGCRYLLFERWIPPNCASIQMEIKPWSLKAKGGRTVKCFTQLKIMKGQFNLKIKSKQSEEAIWNLLTAFCQQKSHGAVYEKKDHVVKNYNNFTIGGSKTSKK